MELFLSSQDGSTPLHYAAINGHYEATQALVRAGCSLEQRKYADGATAMILASNGNHADVVKALLEAGADVSCRLHDSEGNYTVISL